MMCLQPGPPESHHMTGCCLRPAGGPAARAPRALRSLPGRRACAGSGSDGSRRRRDRGDGAAGDAMTFRRAGPGGPARPARIPGRGELRHAFGTPAACSRIGPHAEARESQVSVPGKGLPEWTAYSYFHTHRVAAALAAGDKALRVPGASARQSITTRSPRREHAGDTISRRGVRISSSRMPRS